MVGVIWYRFVRCGGTDWSDTLVPIRPLQWYRFADIIIALLPVASICVYRARAIYKSIYPS